MTVRFRVGDTLVARVAADAARQVPGVLALRPDLTHALLGLAGAALRQDPARRPPDGVVAVVADGRAEIAVTVAVRFGHRCSDVAVAAQRAVADAVAAYTSLPATVTVRIVEVLAR